MITIIRFFPLIYSGDHNNTFCDDREIKVGRQIGDYIILLMSRPEVSSNSKSYPTKDELILEITYLFQTP